MAKLMPSRCQSIARRLAMRAVISRPSRLTVRVSPTLSPMPRARSGVERDERRPVIVGRPPRAGDEPRAGRQRGGIGQPAIAAQCPSRFGRHRRLFDRNPVQPGDAAAHHRHLVEAGARRAVHDLLEPGELVGLDVDKEEAGRRGRQPGFDLAGEVAFDQTPPRPARSGRCRATARSAPSARPAGADWRAPDATPDAAAGEACRRRRLPRRRQPGRWRRRRRRRRRTTAR